MRTEAWKNLQPLRIPGGWTVLYNKLEAVEPEKLPPEDRIWLFAFTEDILHIYKDLGTRRRRQRLAIDLGWYPDGEPSGSFRLAAVLDNDWEHPLLTFSSRSRKEVVDTLEMWLFREFSGCGFMEEREADMFRRNHPVEGR